MASRGLLADDDFNTAIPLSTIRIIGTVRLLVGSYRPGGAITLGREGHVAQAFLLDEPGFHRLRTLLGKLLIVCVRPHRVGMSFETNRTFGLLANDVRRLLQG